MAYYLFQWVYKDPQLRALVEQPQDREAELRKAVEAFGGALHQFFFAFGDYDGIAITEFPDNESCVACVLTIAGAGGNTQLKTTVLIPQAEAKRAMVRAGSVMTGYRPPVGYASLG